MIEARESIKEQKKERRKERKIEAPGNITPFQVHCSYGQHWTFENGILSQLHLWKERVKIVYMFIITVLFQKSRIKYRLIIIGAVG